MRKTVRKMIAIVEQKGEHNTFGVVEVRENESITICPLF